MSKIGSRDECYETLRRAIALQHCSTWRKPYPQFWEEGLQVVLEIAMEVLKKKTLSELRAMADPVRPLLPRNCINGRPCVPVDDKLLRMHKNIRAGMKIYQAAVAVAADDRSID